MLKSIPYLQNITKDILITPNIFLELREKNISVIIDHNAKAMVVCEKFWLYNAENVNNVFKNKKYIASLYFGSGVSCGLILDNKLVRGCSNLSGELGHIKIPRYPDCSSSEEIDETCSCGSKECLEYYIIRDVFNTTRKNFNAMKSSEIKNFSTKTENLKILGYYINWIVDTIIKFLNVDLIVFSGKMTSLLEELWSYITPSIGQSNIAVNDCSMIVSNFGSLSPTIGAAILSTYPANAQITWLI